MFDLSIIIPAFKLTYLKQTIDSFVNQTDQRFQLYVFDDCSPWDIESLCNSFKDKIHISYYRFEQNLGSKSLTKHWNRCVELTNSKWVWLFADDDIADQTCVESFYKALNKNQETTIFRFNSCVLDSNNNIIRFNPPHPKKEDGISSLYFFLANKRSVFVPDHIFLRSIFIEKNGFVDFPLAWCSDAATWFLFSENSKIRLLNSRVFWRLSSDNLSSFKVGNPHKVKAVLLFTSWVLNKLDQKDEENGIPLSLVRAELLKWSLIQVSLYSNLISLRTNYLRLKHLTNIRLDMKILSVIVQNQLKRLLMAFTANFFL